MTMKRHGGNRGAWKARAAGGLIALCAFASAGTASAEKIASKGFQALVAAATQKASAANDEARTLAEKQQQLLQRQEELRRKQQVFENALEQQKLEDERQYAEAWMLIAGGTLAVTAAMAVVGASVPGAGAPAELCRSQSGGIQPVVQDALTKAVAAQTTAVTAVQVQQKRVQERKDAAQRAVLSAQLKALQAAVQRGADVATKLRALMKAVHELKPCT
jgi:hypothetical protein